MAAVRLFSLRWPEVFNSMLGLLDFWDRFLCLLLLLHEESSCLCSRSREPFALLDLLLSVFSWCSSPSLLPTNLASGAQGVCAWAESGLLSSTSSLTRADVLALPASPTPTAAFTTLLKVQLLKVPGPKSEILLFWNLSPKVGTTATSTPQGKPQWQVSQSWIALGILAEPSCCGFQHIEL